MLTLAIQALVAGYLPGAIFVRLPGASQQYRASLSVEERAFWAAILSVLWSLMVVLCLGAVGRYTFERLLVINGIVSLALVVALRGRLRYGASAARPSLTLVLPLSLVLLGTFLYFPPSEYVIGGKDPGTYINEGIQIAQRGRVIVRDADVAAVPRDFRDLFFPSHNQATYYGLRFMGFFIQDPADGRVVGQFPHLYPASIAMGYGLNGLSGARQAIGVWTMLGLLAVYFAGARLFGRVAAWAAAALLAINVVEVWFGRYPNSEMAMQALIFAALLAAGRAREGGRVFFGIVAGALLGLTLFLRYEILLAYVAFASAAVVSPVVRQRLGWPFRVAFAVSATAGLWYLSGPMRAYFAYPMGFLNERGGLVLALAGAAAAASAHRLVRHARLRPLVERWLPPLLAITLGALAVYAYFFRQMEGRTALGDAMAFRTFGWYITPGALALAVIATVLLTMTRFWQDPAFFLTVATFSVFFFYKTRIVAEHFWTSRRFVGVALPGALLLAMALIQKIADGQWLTSRATDASGVPPSRRHTVISSMAVVGVAVGIAVPFWRAATPVRHHVEYAGLIPHLEQLAQRIGDRDLVIVESRNAGSDLHVLAMPLAYIYARHVLVLESAVPDRAAFDAFVTWARTQYTSVLFLGGGGTDLLSRALGAIPIANDHFQVDEYDAPMNAYPTGVRRKEFEYGLYRLVPTAEATKAAIDLQIGALDDLNVVRFHAREVRAETGVKYRWTGAQSFVVLVGMPATGRQVTVWMSDGGRPAQAARPVVEVALDNVVLGTATPVDEVRPYTFAIPPDLAARVAAAAEPVRLRLRVPTWNPGALLGVSDTRDLGIIVTRVEVR